MTLDSKDVGLGALDTLKSLGITILYCCALAVPAGIGLALAYRIFKVLT
jgi:hypothetical protein